MSHFFHFLFQENYLLGLVAIDEDHSFVSGGRIQGRAPKRTIRHLVTLFCAVGLANYLQKRIVCRAACHHQYHSFKLIYLK